MAKSTLRVFQYGARIRYEFHFPAESKDDVYNDECDEDVWQNAVFPPPHR
jgi:hypothetical protein